MANIEVAGFSFIVHDPRDIILCVREKSFLSSILMYLIISVSLWKLLKAEAVRKADLRINFSGIQLHSAKDVITSAFSLLLWQTPR